PLAAENSHSCAVATVVMIIAAGSLAQPGVEQIEDYGGEGRPPGIFSERVVDADEERRGHLCRDRGRAARRATAEESGLVIVQLGRKQGHFKAHDGLLLLGSEWRGTLGVTSRGVERLVGEIEKEVAGIGGISDSLSTSLGRRFAAIPHERAQEAE